MTDRELRRMRKHIQTQPSTVDEWLEAKAKYPSYFTVNSEGNLLSPPLNDGDTEKIIEIDPQVPATKTHIMTYFSDRKNMIQDPEEQYAKAKRALQSIVQAYKRKQATIADVLDINEQVHDAECILNGITKQPRSIINITEEVIQRDLTFNHYDIKSMGDSVFTAQYTTFPSKAFWMSKKELDNETQARIKIQNEESLENTDQESSGKPKRNLTPQQIAIITANRRNASR